MKQPTTSESSMQLRPLLAKLEVPIPDRSSSTNLFYDENQMILLIGGQPVAHNKDLPSLKGTRHTCVQQETTDDN